MKQKLITREESNAVPFTSELQGELQQKDQYQKNRGSQAIYNEQKWLYEHGFYSGVKNNKGAREVDGLLGDKTRAARQAAIKAGYTKDKSGKYIKDSQSGAKLVKKSNPPTASKEPVYDTFASAKEYQRQQEVTNAKVAKNFRNFYKSQKFVNNSPYVTTENIQVPKNDKTYNMLVTREAKKSKPNRWAYLDKASGNIIIHNGTTPVYQSKVISGINKGDGAIDWAGTPYSGNYNYLRKNNIQTTPAGILVIGKVDPNSDYGTRDYNDDIRYEKRRNKFGEFILDESGKIKTFRTGEPMYRLKFAGSDKLLSNALHSTPSAKSQKDFGKGVTRVSSGCVRFPNSSLRYVFDNGLLQQNDTVFSKPELEGNYLYIDDNNKVQLNVGNTTNSNPKLSRFQQKY